MPELPEVETTARGIAPHVAGRRVRAVIVRDRRLRWPVPAALTREAAGSLVQGVSRRAKYLLVTTDAGTMILHLGMSGSLRVVAADSPPGPHDHVDIVLSDGAAVRLRDPRRFGCLLWSRGAPHAHPLLAGLGPEPLSGEFHGGHLHACARGRRVAVKSFIMDAAVVVGVGNIYASEALHASGIHPLRAAGRIRASRYDLLADAIREVLAAAIEKGGTTLRDFAGSDGEPGYFAADLRIYGRAGEACPNCGTPIRRRVIAQRASYYCPRCQR